MSPSKVPGPSDAAVLRRPTVLFVDDDEDTLDFYAQLLNREPVTVLMAPSGLHALELLSRTPGVDLVVSDYSMLGMTGNALLREVGRLYPHVRRILLTGEADSQILLEAPCRVLTKGMDVGLIQRAILRELGLRV